MTIINARNLISVSKGKSTSELNLHLLYSLILLSTLPKVIFSPFKSLIPSSINFHNLSKTLITSLLFSSTTKYLSLEPCIFSTRPNKCLIIKYKGLTLLTSY